jgi:hypothetical protein
MEGLLRALAGTTDRDVDAGHWTKRARTYDGERTVRLAKRF